MALTCWSSDTWHKRTSISPGVEESSLHHKLIFSAFTTARRVSPTLVPLLLWTAQAQVYGEKKSMGNVSKSLIRAIINYSTFIWYSRKWQELPLPLEHKNQNSTWRITVINCYLVRLTPPKTVSPKEIRNLKIRTSTFLKSLEDTCSLLSTCRPDSHNWTLKSLTSKSHYFKAVSKTNTVMTYKVFFP